MRGQDFRDPDRAALEAAIGACEMPFRSGGEAQLHPLRETLYDLMWDKVGIIRDAAGLCEAQRELGALEAQLERCSLPDPNRAFNLTWHDWLNLRSLVSVSGVITQAAIARTDSRGAHFRADFPETGVLEQSAFTSIRQGELTMKPVKFTRVRPGQSLLKDAA